MGERGADLSDVSRVWAAYRHISSLHVRRRKPEWKTGTVASVRLFPSSNIYCLCSRHFSKSLLSLKIHLL